MYRRTICVSIFTLSAAVGSAQAAPPSADSASNAGVQSASASASEDAEVDEDSDSSDAQQGTIVQIERDVVYIDLGQAHGLKQGSTLRVLRTITAKHPISGKSLRDHFPLGQMTVEQVSRVLSFGRLDRRIYGVVKVGDVVRIPPPPVAKTNPPRPSPQAAASAICTAEDKVNGALAAAAAHLERIFHLTKGRTPTERVALLEGYLTSHPNSPYTDSVRVEIEAFRRFADVHERALLAARESVKALADRSRNAEAEKRQNLRRLDILASLPERVDVGDTVNLAITMREPSGVQSAFAYVRRRDWHSYDRIALVPDGDGYFRGRLPAEVVITPSFEIFLEAVQKDGYSINAGTALNPVEIAVDPRATGPRPAQRNKSELRAFFEYVDFNRFKRNDYYLVSEGDFTYRPGTWLAGISAGFGVMYGRGGKNNDLLMYDPAQCTGVDPSPAPCGQRAGFNYGYFETEFRFGKWVSMAPRLLVGQTVQGAGAGGELKLRIGQYTGTNLQLGVSYFKDFGALGSLHLEWNVVRGWPMGASVIVTNLPAQGDVGVRIVYQIAYRARSFLQPALRVGVAARNIEQIGMSVGLGLIAAW